MLYNIADAVCVDMEAKQAVANGHVVNMLDVSMSKLSQNALVKPRTVSIVEKQQKQPQVS